MYFKDFTKIVLSKYNKDQIIIGSSYVENISESDEMPLILNDIEELPEGINFTGFSRIELRNLKKIPREINFTDECILQNISVEEISKLAHLSINNYFTILRDDVPLSTYYYSPVKKVSIKELKNRNISEIIFSCSYIETPQMFRITEANIEVDNIGVITKKDVKYINNILNKDLKSYKLYPLHITNRLRTNNIYPNIDNYIYRFSILDGPDMITGIT